MSFTEKDYIDLTARIIKCCIEVHKELGPGLMESVYEICCEMDEGFEEVAPFEVRVERGQMVECYVDVSWRQ